MGDAGGRARSAIALLLSMPALAWTVELLAGTPGPILLGAAAPAVLFAAAILAAQRGGGRSAGALTFSLAWGAVVAAWLSTTGNGLVRPWIDAVSSGDDRAVTAVVVAPLLEEGAKSLGLLLLALDRRRLRGVRDGIVLGALVGVGFVFTENLLYLGLAMLQGGEAGLLRALWLRGVLGGATHAVFTACAGAGLGAFARARNDGHGTWRPPLLGLLAAYAQHVAWNAISAPAISDVLCGSGEACWNAPTGPALFGASTLIAAASLLPGVVLLLRVSRREEHAG